MREGYQLFETHRALKGPEQVGRGLAASPPGTDKWSLDGDESDSLFAGGRAAPVAVGLAALLLAFVGVAWMAVRPSHKGRKMVTVVEEEDRSRSLIIFGLPEVENEEEEPLHDAVVGVFEQLGEKPRLDARRLRTKRDSNNRPRPVKETV